MPFCRYCAGITLESLQSGYPHQPSWQALQASAKDCALCNLFKEELQASLAYHRRYRFDQISDLEEEFIAKRGQIDEDLPRGWDMGLQTSISVEFDRTYLHEDRRVAVHCGSKRDTRVLDMQHITSYIDFNEHIRKGPNPDWTSRIKAVVDVYIHDGFHVTDPGISIDGVVGTDPGSEANYSMLRRWIEECVTSHTDCCLGFPLRTPMEPFRRPLPKRLIDVAKCQSSQHVFISEPVDRLGSYVALSHRWSSSGNASWTTTVATLDDRKTSIDLAILPKTYQDAIIITINLGQQYLWIDSLCIIQDSAEDWERESANMGNIYQNSLVTICASGAEDSHKGCLARREPGLFDPVVLEQPKGSDRPRQLYIYRQVYTYRTTPRDTADLFFANIDQGPLGSRAWAMQERVLSPRNIHYGKEQIFWECVRNRYAEGGPRFIDKGSKNGLLAMSEMSYTERNPHEFQASAKPSQGYLSSPRWFVHWYLMVEFYTVRKLSRTSDKLPALSGLASQTQQHTGDQYLAGLWSSCLHYGLAWRVNTHSLSSRPKSYRAPSWSWASIDGPVRYMMESPVSLEKVLPAIDVLNAHIEPRGLDKLGEVAAGWIKLAGPLKMAHFKRSHPRTIFEPCDSQKSLDEAIGDYYDDAKQTWDDVRFYCLRLSIFPITQGPSIPTPQMAMILQPTFESAGQYRRVGLGIIRKPDWFDECPRTTITII